MRRAVSEFDGQGRRTSSRGVGIEGTRRGGAGGEVVGIGRERPGGQVDDRRSLPRPLPPPGGKLRLRRAGVQGGAPQVPPPNVQGFHPGMGGTRLHQRLRPVRTGRPHQGGRRHGGVPDATGRTKGAARGGRTDGPVAPPGGRIQIPEGVRRLQPERRGRRAFHDRLLPFRRPPPRRHPGLQRRFRSVRQLRGNPHGRGARRVQDPAGGIVPPLVLQPHGRGR
mmetsp:Transcript_20862/g.42090  ORF Transcript_20862/g.42090 Transcript_20862/m.42090 type:complete len:223 (+) Transcript_20862:292-960(+)